MSLIGQSLCVSGYYFPMHLLRYYLHPSADTGLKPR